MKTLLVDDFLASRRERVGFWQERFEKNAFTLRDCPGGIPKVAGFSSAQKRVVVAGVQVSDVDVPVTMRTSRLFEALAFSRGFTVS